MLKCLVCYLCLFYMSLTLKKNKLKKQLVEYDVIFVLRNEIQCSNIYRHKWTLKETRKAVCLAPNSLKRTQLKEPKIKKI